MANVVAVNKKKQKQSKFERLWRRANVQKAANENLKASLEGLILRVQSEVMPYEKALAESQKPLSIKLLTLGQRKTMTNWERETLHHWVTEVFEDLQEFDLIDEDLRNHMARYDAFRLGIELEDSDAPYQELGQKIRQYQVQAQERYQEEVRQAKEQEQQDREAMLTQGHADIEHQLDKIFGPRPEQHKTNTGDLWESDLDEAVASAQAKYDREREILRSELRRDLEEDIALIFNDDGDDDALDLDEIDDLDAYLNEQAEKIFNTFNEVGSVQEKTIDSPLSAETFQRLFRATAAKLHPDRERDPTLRDEKQRLMANLLKARKRGDIITVIELYKTWVDEHDELSQSDERALYGALEKWIRTLEEEEQEIISESPMHYHVFHQYYHESARQVDRAVKQRIEALHRAATTNQRLGVTIKSLKSLKPCLEDRFQQHRWSLGY